MLRILFLTSEVTPFSRTGKQGDVSAALPRALKKVGHEVRVVTPRYGSIRERRYGLREVARLRSLNIAFGRADHPAAVKSGFIPNSKVQIYFVENADLFPRAPSEFGALETAPNIHIASALLVHCALQLTTQLEWYPDIIYCCNWTAALAPYIVRRDPAYAEVFARARTALHLFSDAVELPLPAHKAAEIGLDNIPGGLEISLLQLGIESADLVIGQDGTSGGMMEFLCGAKGTEWNPRTDPVLSRNYGSEDISQGKAANKEALQRSLGLTLAPHTPLVALWSPAPGSEAERMFQAIETEIPHLPAQLVVIGNRGTTLQRYAERWSKEFEGKVAVIVGAPDAQLRQIKAGTDIALIPHTPPGGEPHPVCSLLYGAVPVISQADGVDFIENFDSDLGRGNGFCFAAADGAAMVVALRRAMNAYQNPSLWEDMQRRGMNMDYCWEQTARRLTDSFHQLLQRPPQPPSPSTK